VYLLYRGSHEDLKTTSYELKIFDPVSETSESLSEISLPQNSTNFSYAAGKIFYSLQDQEAQPRAIGFLDLRTQKCQQLVQAPPDTRSQHFFPSYLVTHDAILFLRCSISSREALNVDECSLERISLHETTEKILERIRTLRNVFQETRSPKAVFLYLPRTNSVVVSEYLNSSTYDNPVSAYHEVPLNPDGDVKAVTQNEITQREKEIRDALKEQCMSATVQSEVFNADRVVGVYPPQVRLGCVLSNELKDIYH